MRAADRQWAIPAGRRLGVLFEVAISGSGTATDTATPRATRETVRTDRSSAHPRGAAPDPVHAEGRGLCRARVGSKRWALTTWCAISPLRSAEHARFKQTDADVGSFDGGYGSAYLARQVGQKFARQIFFLGEEYTAAEALRMGMVNAVVPHDSLKEQVALEWATKINAKSPTAQRMLKFAFNALDDGLVGQQIFVGEATRLAYQTDEAVRANAFLEKREPDWSRFPWSF